MQPVEFPGCNVVFAKDQPEYRSLPARRDEDGLVTSCYRLTWFERLHVLLHGTLYLQTLTFRAPLQPQRPSVTNPRFDKEADDA